jgi:hypothetical protein
MSIGELIELVDCITGSDSWMKNKSHMNITYTSDTPGFKKLTKAIINYKP